MPQDTRGSCSNSVVVASNKLVEEGAIFLVEPYVQPQRFESSGISISTSVSSARVSRRAKPSCAKCAAFQWPSRVNSSVGVLARSAAAVFSREK